MTTLNLFATTTFGLEAVVSRELKHLGYTDQQVQDGRVTFQADEQAICRCNLWLRSAERVFLKVGSFSATDFGELFDQTTALPWEQWLCKDARFPVQGRSVRSQLHSVPNCQAIVKKAIVERLKKSFKQDWFEETGPAFAVEVSILKDEVTLAIDTSGVGLHKRGYRKLTGLAPLKETLAAALIQLSYWNWERPLIDPFCGSGTIPIEAALIGRNIAPGLNREFSSQHWPWLATKHWTQAREEANDIPSRNLDFTIIGTDVDEKALSLARYHAERAGVEDQIHFQQKPLSALTTKRKYGCLICNPPYGERLGELSETEELYRDMGRVFSPLETWSLYILTSHSGFEKVFGRRADRRRKLYNGRIQCAYYQFYGPRPPLRKQQPQNSSLENEGPSSTLETMSVSHEQDYQQQVHDTGFTRFLPESQIEVVREFLPENPPRFAIFDFDGTLSLIRTGWQDVMVPMMVEILSETETDETPEQLRLLIRDFVDELTGRQTIYQMLRLAEEVTRRNGKPQPAASYKQRFDTLLLDCIAHRKETLRSGLSQPEEMLIPFSQNVLRELKQRDVQLYLVSGTDEVFVREEIELLGLDAFFGNEIYGAVDDYKSFSKQIVIERILSENNDDGSRLIGFGDGFVETENVKQAGGVAIGVASDETEHSDQVNSWKRKRLLGVGADVIIPDYRDYSLLCRFLWKEA